jgi:hypothetical protein
MGVMPFIINLQHRIPSKKLKKSNMLTKLPLKGKVEVGEAAVVAIELTTSKKELVWFVQTATQQDKQNCFNVVEHFVEHGKRLEAPKP